MSKLPARVLSVNLVRTAPPALTGGGSARSGIHRRPVVGQVPIRLMGLQGDEQADRSAHGGQGGVSKAIYAYPHTHYAFWQTVRAQAGVAGWGEALAPGSLGENLTLEGLQETDLWVGDRLRLPHCLLAVSEPRMPWAGLNAALGFQHAEKLMAQSGYCGSFLLVLEAGTVGAGDAIEVVPGPREVNIKDLFRARMRPD
ncbi:MOSC domain-containing protein [Rubrivivax rivuli]|uniref:MOSC domain-containing protein n=1 Tax=Rubrivivax rivuli TaxID=1862385 RepID=A0A437RRW6_9BURK|nr:MOSC domain-containing protein [Rubrivivax rivuli]RVU49528.1 MOSC domain-containing protein [Rubrivivax rivuli]